MTRSALQGVLLSGLVMLGAVLLASYNTVDYDVAYLTWAAHAVAGGAVYGVDILDINPPLCMLVYMPAALLADAVGFEWGVRLAMLGLSLLSLACFWHTAERPLRLRVGTVFVTFLLLAYPNHFAQREQLALLLCAPYVAGPAPRRGWAIASGDPAPVYRLALDQAKRELGRRPELVLVAQYGQDNGAWDMLGWYQRDAGFRDLWKDYRRDRMVGPVMLYRRTAPAP